MGPQKCVRTELCPVPTQESGRRNAMLHGRKRNVTMVDALDVRVKYEISDSERGRQIRTIILIQNSI
jgi:hypothetical protein